MLSHVAKPCMMAHITNLITKGSIVLSNSLLLTLLLTFCCQGFFGFSGIEIRPHFQWNLGDFFPNFEKNPYLQKNFFF